MSISIEQLLNLPGVEVLKTEVSEREISIHVKHEFGQIKGGRVAYREANTSGKLAV